MTGRRSVRRTRRLQIQPEILEVRQLLATFTVNNTGDTGPGSLRDAMTQANTSAGPDTIAFAIPGSGVHTISPLSALPVLTGAVTIDGTTQGVITSNPLIEINGTNAGLSSGLVITGGASVIQALTINRFQLLGINLASAGNAVFGCFIGVDSSGLAAAANGQDGIQISGLANVIGGVASTSRNVISGNLRNGISITGVVASGNSILNNVIGVDKISCV